MADFGADVSTYPNGLDPTFTPITGPQVLIEHIARMLETAEGTHDDDPEFAFLLASVINSPQTTASLQRLAGRITAKVMLDARVRSADVESTFDATRRALRIDLRITPIDGQPFRFVLLIDAVTVAILEGAP